jgi:hypothetical protein
MKQLLHSPPKVLKSKFKIGYSLVLQSMNHDYVKKSLMMTDIEHQINSSNELILKLTEEQDSLFYDMSLIHDYVELRNNLLTPFNSKKKINEIKQHMKKKENLELFQELEKYDKSQECIQKIKVETERKNYALGYIDRQICVLEDILSKNGFKESPKKEIAEHLHEIHPLVFTELLVKCDFFKEYSTIDFFTLLSCFCEIKVNENFKNLSPIFLKEECTFIQERMNYYTQEEWNHDLSASGQDVIQYDMMEFIQKWMNSTDEHSSLLMLQEVKSKKGIFVGDFIKCCLKMVNIAKELERIERLDFREKLREGTDKLMKFICTHDSLYL